MLKKLKVGHIVAIMPILAVVGFVLVIFNSLWTGQQNTERLENIKSGYFPSLQLSRDLEVLLDKLQRSMQDAVSAADVEALSDIRVTYNQFLKKLNEAKQNPVRKRQEVEALTKKFKEYYSTAYMTSKQMIASETGEGGGNLAGASIVKMMETMRSQYNSVRAELNRTTKNDDNEMQTAFDKAQLSNKTTTTSSIITAVIFVLLMIVVAWQVSRSVVSPVNDIAKVAGTVADGDFSTAEVNVKGKNEIAQLGRSIERMVDNLRRQMRSIGKTVGQLSAASAETLALAKQIESNAEDEASSVDETRRTMQGMLEAANDIAAGANSVVESADRSTQASQTIAERITKLNIQAIKITDISETIKGIADKTDILALNAALEGTKAGEAGRGFALVGGEMRRLAETVSDAVRQIKQLANDIRELSQSAVLAGEEGQKLARETTDTAKRITLITNQQRTATEQVSRSMDDLQQFAQQSVRGAKQSRTTADVLATAAEELSNLLEGIQVHRNDEPASNRENIEA